MKALDTSRVPFAEYGRALLGLHMTRLRSAWQRREAGASAVELAIITAIVVILAGVVLGVVAVVVRSRSAQITSKNGGITGN